MQRQMLRLTLILGVMVTLLGGTGVFAVFTDQASGGINSVTSGSLAKAADLQIAGAQVTTGVACGTFADSTATQQFLVTDLGPSSSTQRSYACLRNVGASLLSLTLTAAALRDLDNDCTGDEAATGDASCGGNGVGELSPVVNVHARQVDCTNRVPLTGLSQTLDRWGTAAFDYGAPALAPNATVCVEFELAYAQAATATQRQLAQSDTSTWSFRFEGTAS